MRVRALVRIVLLGSLATYPLALSQSVAPLAAPSDSERQSAALPEIKLAVLKATGYADAGVTWSVEANQFWVTVVNSPLNQATVRQREEQASGIVAAIVERIKQDPVLVGVIGIHVDYVARSAAGRIDVVDGIDFRKGPGGTFEHHTT